MRPTMALFLSLTGVMCLLVGLLSGTAMVVCIFLMAALAVGFFAPAFASLSRIVQPTMRSLAAGFAPPIAFLLGGGLLPAGLGYLGQAASFSLGITITGAVILVGSSATLLLRAARPTSKRAADQPSRTRRAWPRYPPNKPKAEALARFQSPPPEHINCGQAVFCYALLRLEKTPKRSLRLGISEAVSPAWARSAGS